MLFRFLFRNLKGYRLLVGLVIFVTIAQVFCSICMTFPLKFIPSKVQNAGNDPSCIFPFLNPILDQFDIPQIDHSLAPLAPGQPPQIPHVTQCPVSPADPNPILITSHHSTNGVIVFSVLMLLVFGILNALLAYLNLYLAAYIAQNLTARLRAQLFDHLQRLSLDWHGKQKKGDLVNRIIGNIADIEKLVTDGLVDLLAGVLTLAGVVTVMLFLSRPYTLITLAMAPALFVATLGYTRNITAAAKRASKATGLVSDVATEGINVLTAIKVFTREEKESLRSGNSIDTNRRTGRLQTQFTPLVGMLVALGTAAVVGVGGYVAAGNAFTIGFFTIPPLSVDIGTLILFLILLNLLYQPMRDLSKLAMLASSAGSGAERIQEVLDHAPAILESAVPYTGPTRLRGDITFENVIFGYTSGQPVLNGINLHLPVGKKVALVGLSGGGKTTLVKLIPRFYEVTQGSVRIDGVDNRQYLLQVLRQNVSMVLQESVLFEGTIAENIAIGRPGAPLQEIIEAAKKANIHDVIVNTLGGYDRMVREQGKVLSDGQRQRIAIARAILRDAPILILDEPTAALDVEAEAEVMHALDKLIIGRTVLMISHRLSTLGNVEEIIVLKDGRIAERGSFKELKRMGGVFATLLEEQNRYNQDRAGDQSILRSAFVPLPVGAAYTSPRLPITPIPPVPQGWQAPVPLGQPVSAMAAIPQYNGAPQAPLLEQRPPDARLVVEIDGKVMKQYVLDKPMMTIGRLSSNDIQVPSQRVSRLHAKIRSASGTWTIEDVESLNGLVYQGQRIDRLVLHSGDRLYMAPTVVLHYQTTP